MSTTRKIINKVKEKKESQNEIDSKIFAESLNVIAKTKEGQYVLNYLMSVCGQNRSSRLSADDKEGTIDYREGRRSVWLNIQNVLNQSNLKKVMFFNRRNVCQSKKKLQEKDMEL